jgi:phage replication initiation protein
MNVNFKKKSSPATLTGQESSLTKALHAVFIDWLTVTFKPHCKDVGLWAHQFLNCLIPNVVGVEAPAMMGYSNAVRFYVPLMDTPVYIGRIDFGGDFHKNRARLDLSGTGCSKINDWQVVQDTIEDLDDSKITRVDLAVDCLNGEYKVTDALGWLQNGEFNAGGRNPRHSTPGDWANPSYLTGQGIRYGRTLETGRRENGKMMRAYEKGRQLGDSNSDWTRFEVELRNIDRDLPMDILTESKKYFAGAYRCLERLISSGSERIATHQKEGEISIAKLTEYAKTAYGQLFSVLRIRLSVQEIFDELSRPGIPRRLHKSALLGFPAASPTAFQT